MPKPRFDGTINTGHLLTMLTIVVGFLLTAFGAFGVYKDQQAAFDKRFSEIQTSIMRLQDGMEEDKRTITRNKSEGDERAKHWIEVIERNARANEQQDERLNTIGKLLSDTVTSIGDLSRTVAAVDKGFAVLQDRMAARGELPLPRGR